MSQEMKHNKTKITVVSYDEFTDDDFNPPSTYFVLAASGYYFIHTSKRDVAQAVVNDHFGHNRYKVKASRLQKGSGGVTAR